MKRDDNATKYRDNMPAFADTMPMDLVRRVANQNANQGRGPRPSSGGLPIQNARLYSPRRWRSESVRPSRTQSSGC